MPSAARLRSANGFVAENPQNANYRSSLVIGLDRLSECLHHGCWKLSEAAATRERAIRELMALMSLDPKNPKYEKHLLEYQGRALTLAEERGQFEEAEKYRATILSSHEKLSRQGQDLTGLNWALVRTKRIDLLLDAGKNAEAETELRALIRDADEEVAASFEPHDRFRQGLSRQRLAEILHKQGRIEDALTLNHEAIDLLRDLVADFPRYGVYRFHFHGSLLSRADWIYPDQRTEAEAALAEVESSIRQLPEDAANRFTQVYEVCVAFAEIGQNDRAEAFARDSLTLAKRKLPKDSKPLATSMRAMAEILFKKGENPEAEEHARNAAGIFRLRPTERGHDLAWTLFLHGRILANLNHDDEAMRSFLEAGMLFHESSLAVNGVGYVVSHAAYVMSRQAGRPKPFVDDPRWAILTAEHTKH